MNAIEYQEEIRKRDQRIAELEAQLAGALSAIGALQSENEQLREKMAELERSGKRQATPFSRNKAKKEKKKSGRKRGKGIFRHRNKPSLSEVNDTKEEKLSSCPDCGGSLQEHRQHEQYEIDIPEVKPVITRFVTESGYCRQCRKRVRSQHPEQISQAAGAAGVVIGPRAKALASDLKHRLGLSYEKVSDLLNQAFGLQATRSGWYQADERLAVTAYPVYLELIDLVRKSAVVHVDETGWRVNVLSAWLWVFTNREITVYAIEYSRGHDVVIEILGKEFAGILVSDCFTAYNDAELADWLKQKCLSHLLKNLADLRDSKSRGAIRFAQDLMQLLRDALALTDERPKLSSHRFDQRAAEIEQRLDWLIDEQRQFTDPDNNRMAARLRKHREHLLRFLYVEGLDATNNQAERMLRPAVITRKTNGCNKTDLGAAAHAVLSSILVTCRQRAISILDFFIKLQRFGDPTPSFAPT
jgi:transposase